MLEVSSCMVRAILEHWLSGSSQAKKQRSTLKVRKRLWGCVLQELGLTVQGALLDPLLLMPVLKLFNALVGITVRYGKRHFVWLRCMRIATAELGGVTSNSQALCLSAVSQLLAARLSSCLCSFWFNTVPALSPF